MITLDEFVAIPLTPVEEMPLHEGGHDFPDGVFGCAAPERPLDGRTLHDWRCRGCVLHAQACLLDGDPVGEWWRDRNAEPEHIPLSWSVSRALHQIDLGGMS